MLIYHQLLSAFDELCQSKNYTAVIKRAWQLCQADAVQKVNVYSKNMINGIVKDMELYAVVIDPEHIRYSTCPCQQTGYCEHIGALFFQYSKSLENGKVLAEQAYFQLLGVTKASAVVPQANKREEAAAKLQNPEALIEHLYASYGDEWRKCKHSFHSLSQTLTSIKGIARQYPYEIQRLHWCTSILFVLYLGERALQAVDSFSRYYHEISFKRIAEPWLQNLYEWFHELQSKPLTDKELQWIDQLLTFTLQRASSVEKPMIEWDYIYYKLVSLLAGNNTEQQKLEQQLRVLLSQEHTPFVQTIIYGSLAVLKLNQHEDEAAIEFFNQCQFEKIQKLIYPIVDNRMQAAKWDQVELWMDMLMQKFSQQQHSRSIGPFLSLCRKLSLEQTHNPKWSQMMILLLPHSYTALAEHYVAQKQYEKWADLQMYMGRKLEDVKGGELQNIERQAPTALLPLYHQAVDTSIHLRNRQGYRMAAKYMKRLQEIYEALDQMHIWNKYFDSMQQKYNRLRAFQEELMKGKLL